MVLHLVEKLLPVSLPDKKIIRTCNLAPANDGIQLVELPEALKNRRRFRDPLTFRRIKKLRRPFVALPSEKCHSPIIAKELVSNCAYLQRCSNLFYQPLISRAPRTSSQVERKSKICHYFCTMNLVAF